jgi:hypothetical protein
VFSRTHLWFRKPENSCIPIAAKTMTVTKHRRQMFAIYGKILSMIEINCCSSGKIARALIVRRILTALNTEIPVLAVNS